MNTCRPDRAPRALLVASTVAVAAATLAVAPGRAGDVPRLSVVRSDVRGIVLTLDTPLAAVQSTPTDAGSARILRGEGFAVHAETGLPERGVLVGVPAGVRVRLTWEAGEPSPIVGSDGPSGRARRPGARAVGAVRARADRLAPAEVTNEAWLRDLRVVRLSFHPVAIDPRTGGLVVRTRIVARLSFEGVPHTGAARSDALGETMQASVVANWVSARDWRVAGGVVATPTINPLAASGAWKVSVEQRGWQSFPASLLIQSGLPPGSHPRIIRLYDRNSEVPVHITGGEDGRLDGPDRISFYGQPIDTRFSGTNVYWLAVDADGSGTRIPSRSVEPEPGDPLRAFTDTLRFEQNLLYDGVTQGDEGEDRFYWAEMVAGAGGGDDAHTIGFDLPGLVDGPAQLTLRLKSAATGTHRVRVTLNGSVVVDETWTGSSPHLVGVTLPDASRLKAAANEVALQSHGTAGGRVLVDWLDVDYPRDFDVRGAPIEFDAEADAPCQIEGLPTKAADVIDVTEPDRPVVLVDVALAGPAPGPYYARFGALQGRRYLVVPAGGRPTPSVALDTPDDLTTGMPADVIVVAPSDFRSAAIALRTYRTSQGFRVRVVDVQDAFDTYSDGEPDPAAIRDMASVAYARWPSPPPSYLLLLGDGHYDYRQFTTSSRWFVPPYMVEEAPGAGEIASDNAFATISGSDELPDLAVGRLPVTTAGEASTAVMRLQQYELGGTAAWQQRASFFGDDGPADAQPGDAYADLLADVARALPDHFFADTMVLATSGEPSPSTMRARIRDVTSEGRGVVGYLGEGARDRWASEGAWRIEDAVSMTNDVLPVMLELTSRTGDFAVPSEPGLAERHTNAATGGAIGSWAASSSHVGAGYDDLGDAWLRGVYRERMRAGSAAAAAKASLYAQAPARLDLVRGLNWFGDPTLIVGGTVPRDPVSPTPLGSPSATPTHTSTPQPSTTPTVGPTDTAPLPSATASLTATWGPPTSTTTPEPPGATDTGTATPAPPTATDTATSTPPPTEPPIRPVLLPLLYRLSGR